MQMLQCTALFDLSHTIAAPHLAQFRYPWEALETLKDFIRALGPTLNPDRFEQMGDDVWIAKSAKIAPSAHIGGPCIVDEEAEIRHCAFVRGSAVIGKHAVVGNSTEIKNAILFDYVQAPHFNYCGDSILGYKAHIAAGVITSNVKGDKSNVVIRYKDQRIETGRRKLGAMLGDYAEVGCNTVFNPGAIVGRNTNVYPLSRVRGVVEPDCIFKSDQCIVKKH